MSVAPRSVWVDAQGAQSAGYAERGIGRFIGEQISAVNNLSPVVGSIHLDPDHSIPATLNDLISTELLQWGPNRPSPGIELPGIYHVYVNYYGAGERPDIITTARIAIIQDEGSPREKQQVFSVPLRKPGELTLVRSFVVGG